MPTIAIVDGVKIQMFYNDHTPPHFHAILAGDEVLVAVRSLDVIRGSLPPAKLRRVITWAQEHQGELALNWIKCQDDQTRRGFEMPNVLDNIITAAVPDTSAYSVTLTWANGATTVNSFRHLIGKGASAPLTDPTVFAQVRVGERGRSIEWPGEIDFCADALWFETHPADAPQQPRQAADQPTQHTAH